MLRDKLLSPTRQVSSNTSDPGGFRQSWLHHLQGSGQNKNVRPQTGVVSPLHETVSAQNFLQIRSSTGPHLIFGWDLGREPMESPAECTAALPA